jgi:subtilisin family serine protease
MGRKASFIVGLSLAFGASTTDAAPSLVTLDQSPSLSAFARWFVPGPRDAADPEAWNYLAPEVKGAIHVLEATYGFRAIHGYSKVMVGFMADLTPEQVAGLRFEPLVESITVTVDASATAAGQRQSWGLSRIGAVPAVYPGGDPGATPPDLSGVTVYIIDSGIEVTNPDLNVRKHVNFAGGPNTDCNGHGTHVAGTLGSRDNDFGVRGVAPGAPLVGVKVVDCAGNGSSATIIKGIDWMVAHAKGPSVLNLSVGGGASPALDAAVQAAHAASIFVVIAAGNSATDACLLSPSLSGTVAGILTVGAMDVNEAEAPFSNFGGCVDLWAPGVSITSLGRGVGGLRTLSGTSMATPHAAGAAALFLAHHPEASPADVESALMQSSVIPGTASKDGRTILRLRVNDQE